MENPKTTVAGYALLVAAVATAFAHAWGKLSSGDVGGALGSLLTDWPALLTALTGVGLIHASDGTP